MAFQAALPPYRGRRPSCTFWRDLGLEFPVAVDNNFAIWRAFNNEYWPAHYFVDAQGRIRFHKFGEGDYERSEQVIRQLLQEPRDAGGGA